MYDELLLQEAAAVQGLNHYRLALLAKVDPKTAKSVLETGGGNAESVYRVAAALGFSVKKWGTGKIARYDFSAIMKKPRKGKDEPELVGASRRR